MLSVESVSAGYGPADVLREISLQVRSGELVAVIGSNGAGKTTLMRAISGLLRCRRGSICLEGRDVTRLPPHERVELGIVQVPEGRQVFGPLTVRENLLLGAFGSRRRAGLPPVGERLDAVCTMFPRLGERLRQRAGQLSGGEQQMLAIGRAMMTAPRLLLLDEPSLGLAPKVVDEIFVALERLKADGMPILLVEQNARLALAIAQRAYVLDVGRVVLAGTAAELLGNDAVRRAYLGGERDAG